MNVKNYNRKNLYNNKYMIKLAFKKTIKFLNY